MIHFYIFHGLRLRKVVMLMDSENDHIGEPLMKLFLMEKVTTTINLLLMSTMARMIFMKVMTTTMMMMTQPWAT